MFRTGVLLDRSITNVAIIFHVSAECEDACQSDEDQSDGHVVGISHVMAIRSKLEENKQIVMDDTFVQPCLQESEDWPRLYHDIEVQRETGRDGLVRARSRCKDQCQEECRKLVKGLCRRHCRTVSA